MVKYKNIGKTRTGKDIVVKKKTSTRSKNVTYDIGGTKFDISKKWLDQHPNVQKSLDAGDLIVKIAPALAQIGYKLYEAGDWLIQKIKSHRNKKRGGAGKGTSGSSGSSSSSSNKPSIGGYRGAKEIILQSV